MGLFWSLVKMCCGPSLDTQLMWLDRDIDRVANALGPLPGITQEMRRDKAAHMLMQFDFIEAGYFKRRGIVAGRVVVAKNFAVTQTGVAHFDPEAFFAL